MIKKAWYIGKDFFIAKKERRAASFLVTASIILQLGMVYSAVLMNEWSNDFYSALQALDKNALYSSLATFCVIITLTICIFMSKYTCQAWLGLRWRQFMTEKYYAKWIETYAYCSLEALGYENDNPDQRVSEDVHSFINLTISLSLGIIDSIVTLASFIAILWSLSGALKFQLFGFDCTIPGYLVWTALIYSLFGTVVTYIIGRRLSGADYLQEQKEANFRFALMRVRENAESIALYKGGNYEKVIFKMALSEVISNSLAIIKINKNLGIWGSFFGNISSIIPILIVLPRFFAKEIMLGGLMQIRSAFDHVHDSLSFLANSFASIASYKAVIDRLTGFNEHVEKWCQILQTKEIKISYHESAHLVLKELTIRAPDNHILINNLNLTFIPGNSYLITGNNGCGKSTLIKAIAGIWTFGEGSILFPHGHVAFFIPQKPYMRYGTLAQAIMYPDYNVGEIERLSSLLKEVNLGYLVERLDQQENWSTSLSLGEQQKIAILRAVVHNPDILIMDESSSALTEEDEKVVYQLIKTSLSHSIIISIGHRSSLKQLHNHIEVKLKSIND